MSAPTRASTRADAPAADVDLAARLEPFRGTRRLVRFALRRDRVRLVVWTLSISGLVAYFGAALPVVYPDPAAYQTRAAIMRDPSGAFMTGPGYGLDDYGLGTMFANEMVGMFAVAVGLMSIFLVVRHTRAEEETGRAELVRSAVVGRRAHLTAAVVHLVVANAVVGGVLLAAMASVGLGGPDAVAVVAGIALVGLTFGGVAAVTAQVAEHARAAAGLAGAVLGLAYVLRGIGDAQQTGGGALSWASPIGWAQQTRAFVDLRWWPLLLCLVTAAALVGVAHLLSERRDVGAGLLRARPGRAHARRGLLSPVGLAVRTQRAEVAGWAVGLLVFGVLTGSMGQAIVDGFESQPELAVVFGAAGGADLLRATLSAFLGFFAMAVAVYAVVSVNRLGREEDAGRTAAVLATAVGRPRWLASQLLVTTVASTLLLLVAGASLGAGAGASVGDGALVGELALGSLAHLPVVLGFAGAAALAHGLRTGTWWVWALLVASIVVGLYGPLLDLPDVVLDAAPFGLVPAVPGEAWSAPPLVALTGVAAGLTAIGAAGLRRRDLVA